MAKQFAARCSPCNMNYPKDRSMCPICGGETWTAAEEDFDADWKAQVADRKARFKWDADREAGVPLPNAVLEPRHLIEYEDRLYVSDPTMEAEGYPCVASGDIVQINGNFYEVMGAQYPKTDEKGWWINLVPLLEWPRQMAVMSPEEYHHLDIARGLRV